MDIGSEQEIYKRGHHKGPHTLKKSSKLSNHVNG